MGQRGRSYARIQHRFYSAAQNIYHGTSFPLQGQIVAVLIPRIRTIGIRLSEDEYSSLEKFCAESGARSISDLARVAICSFITRKNDEHELASTVGENLVHVKELEAKVERLSAEIDAMRATAGKKSFRPLSAQDAQEAAPQEFQAKD